MEHVRNLFLIGINCGYRYSDLKNVRIYNEGQEYYFETKHEKTNKKVKIPLLDNSVIAIFKKYQNKIPTYSREFFNEQIKLIALRAGLKEKVEVATIDPETTKLVKTYPATWEMISTKTCRKTFCSLLVREHNIPLSVAMSYSGHETERSFKTYIKLTEQEYYEIGMRQLEQMKLRKVGYKK